MNKEEDDLEEELDRIFNRQCKCDCNSRKEKLFKKLELKKDE